MPKPAASNRRLRRERMPREVRTWPTLSAAMGWAEPRKAVVDRVMKELGQVDDKAACRRHVADAIQQVAHYEYIPPGERRRQLKATANTLERALKKAKNLPDLDILRAIEQARRAAEDRSAKIEVKRSGGAKAEAGAKHMAALLALDIILEHGEGAPKLTLEPPDEWVRLSFALYAAAVPRGRNHRDEDGSPRYAMMDRACRAVYGEHEFSRAKKMTKAADSEPPKWLEEESSKQR